jgi:hypothetical protein
MVRFASAFELVATLLSGTVSLTARPPADGRAAVAVRGAQRKMR